MSLERVDRFALLLLLAVGLLATFPLWSQLDRSRVPEKNDDWDNQLLIAEAQRESIVHYHVSPLWNQYTEGGTPLLGNPESTIAYPLTWITLPFSSQVALKLQMVLHFFIGLAGGYCLGRSLNLSAQAAGYGAAVFMLASIFPERMRTGHLMWMGMAWLPWIVRAGFAWSSKDRLVAALLLSAQWLLGAHYLVIYSLSALLLIRYHEQLKTPRVTRWSLILLLIALMLCRACPATWRPLLLLLPIAPMLLWQPRALGTEARRLALVLLLFSLFSAVKLLPALELWSFSPRFSIFEQLLPPRDGLWQSIAKWAGWLARDVVEVHEDQPTLYHSLPLWLALFGALLTRKDSRPFVFLGVVAWLWSLGARSPLSVSALGEALPVWSLIRYTARAAVLSLLTLGVLAAFGVQTLEASLGRMLTGNTARLARAALMVGLTMSLVWMTVSFRDTYGGVFMGDTPVVKQQYSDFSRLRCQASMYRAFLDHKGCIDGFTAVPLVNARHIQTAGDREYEGEAFVADSSESARVVSRSPIRLGVQVAATSQGGLLVLNQSYYPGWQVAEGGTTESWQGLLATHLQPSRSQYTFVYRPRSVLIGLGITLSTFIGSLLLLFWRVNYS